MKMPFLRTDPKIRKIKNEIEDIYQKLFMKHVNKYINIKSIDITPKPNYIIKFGFVIDITETLTGAIICMSDAFELTLSEIHIHFDYDGKLMFLEPKYDLDKFLEKFKAIISQNI
jgi:hypothetical protein